MRGVTAKKLRKIAASLGLKADVGYTPGGPLRRRSDFTHPETGEIIQGAPIRRPLVMVACVRRACKEAKKVYKGLPMTALVPENELREKPFHARVVDSMRQYRDA
jgi:hypothetical protein